MRTWESCVVASDVKSPLGTVFEWNVVILLGQPRRYKNYANAPQCYVKVDCFALLKCRRKSRRRTQGHIVCTTETWLHLPTSVPSRTFLFPSATAFFFANFLSEDAKCFWKTSHASDPSLWDRSCNFHRGPSQDAWGSYCMCDRERERERRNNQGRKVRVTVRRTADG